MWFCHTSGYSNCCALHILYTVPIYIRIYTVESACASSCGVWLAQWLVRMNAHRARAGSNPTAVHDRHFAASIGNQYYTVEYITSADSHRSLVLIFNTGSVLSLIHI